jgi:hypothetical protein
VAAYKEHVADVRPGPSTTQVVLLCCRCWWRADGHHMLHTSSGPPKGVSRFLAQMLAGNHTRTEHREGTAGESGGLRAAIVPDWLGERSRCGMSLARYGVVLD